jgi:hypothetical protein
LFAIQNLAANHAFGLTVDRNIKSLGHEALADLVDGLPGTAKCLHNLGVGPHGTIGIRLEQNGNLTGH